MLKRDKEETFSDLWIPSCPKLWEWHTVGNIVQEWQFVTWQQFWMKILPSFCWETIGKAGLLKMWKNTKQKSRLTKAQTKKRKGKQPGVNTLVVPGVQIDLGDGPRTASSDSINSILKYKKIERKVMQFMWKKGIGCIVLTTHTPKKEKGLFMIMNSLSKSTTLMTYCADKFLFIALTFYILKLLFSSELASLNINSHCHFLQS